jgi:GT2 family glycosyltransferase
MSDKKSILSDPAVAIVILNWNSGKDTVACLKSLFCISYLNYEVIIVDNHSEDDSIEMIRGYCMTRGEACCQVSQGNKNSLTIQLRQYHRHSAELAGDGSCIGALPSNRRLILIKNERNYGFAEGNNIGIRYALGALNPKYILLLNNDTIVEGSFLKEMVSVAESDRKIGSVQAMLLKPGGRIIDSMGQEPWIGGTRDLGLDTPYDEEKVKKNQEIFGPCAAAALYRSDALRDVGLLDKDFFVLYEDVDLSWRMQLSGYISRLATSAIVYHKRGISSSGSRSNAAAGILSYYGARNRLMIALRYYPSSIVFSGAFLRAVVRCLLMACSRGRIMETVRLMMESINLRRRISTNPLLPLIQSHWMGQ